MYEGSHGKLRNKFMRVFGNHSKARCASHLSTWERGKRKNLRFSSEKSPQIPIFLVFSSIFLVASLLLFGLAPNHAAAQQSVTSTPTGSTVTTLPGPFITVTYIEPINVRTGPSSFDYPIVGSIPVGGTAPAIGRSPAGEWIQILFPAGPRGTGWVYAMYPFRRAPCCQSLNRRPHLHL
jgi:Bacterial SH3 domain